MERNIVDRHSGRRRKAIIGSAVAVLISAIALPVVSSGAANGPSSNSTINDFVLYAVSTLTLKHGASIGGNIAAGTTSWQDPPGCHTAVAAGTNEYTVNHEMLKSYACSPYGSYGSPAATGSSHINVCLGATPTMTWTDPNAYIVAPSVNMQWSSSHCNVPTIYTTIGKIPASVKHSSFTPPNIVMPALPAATCDKTKNAATYKGNSLAPGSYGNYGIAKTTSLQAGAAYTFCNLSVRQGASLLVPSNTVVNVTGNVSLAGGANGHVGDTAGNATFYVGGALSFGRSGKVFGTFVAPHDDVSLGDTTAFTGHLWAWAIHSDKDVTVVPPTTPPTTSTTSTITTSTSTSTSTTAPTSTTTTTEETTFTF